MIMSRTLGCAQKLTKAGSSMSRRFIGLSNYSQQRAVGVEPSVELSSRTLHQLNVAFEESN
jgi:hypothetical protein